MPVNLLSSDSNILHTACVTQDILNAMHTKCFTLHTVAMCSLFSGGQALHIPCTDTGSPEWGSDAVNKFVKVRRTEKNNSNKQMQNRTDQTSNIQGKTKAITLGNINHCIAFIAVCHVGF